jgi:outer membrane biosynthesis protein TonB
LPLALLIVAVLAAGIVTAFLKADDQGREVAEPTPTITAAQPTDIPTPPEPTEPPTEEPTEEPTLEPTEEPTEEPSPEPTDEGNGGKGKGGDGNGGTDPLLADTGGAVLPWLIGGVLLSAGGAGVWRLRRRPEQAA